MKINKLTLLLLIAALSFASCELIDKANGNTVQSANVKRGLVLYYTFDEGNTGTATMLVKDNSVSGIDGIIQGNASFEADTPSGNGYSLRLRKGDFVNIPDALHSDSTNVTVAFWIKDFSQGNIFTSLISSESTGTPTLYVNEEDKLCYKHRNNPYAGTVCVFANNLVPYQSSGWHHLVCTSSKSTRVATLFIDGVQIDAQSTSQEKISAMKMQIGGLGADPMCIDNVRIYDRCLSIQEIKMLYTDKQ